MVLSHNTTTLLHYHSAKFIARPGGAVLSRYIIVAAFQSHTCSLWSGLWSPYNIQISSSFLPIYLNFSLLCENLVSPTHTQQTYTCHFSSSQLSCLCWAQKAAFLFLFMDRLWKQQQQQVVKTIKETDCCLVISSLTSAGEKRHAAKGFGSRWWCVLWH